MKNKIFCSAFGISADGNRIFGSAHDFNEIYEIDLFTHKMKSLGRLEGEDDTINLVEFIECYSDKVLFVPGSNGRYFHLFDLKTGRQTKILKNKLSGKGSKNEVHRFFSFVWDDKAYIICRDQLSVYCFHPNKGDFEIVFEEDAQRSFKCMSFSIWNGLVAFFSIELNELVLYNLKNNHMERIMFNEQMMGINRIAVTENRIILYRIEDRKIYVLDKKGTLIRETTVLSETESRVMMFNTKEEAYLIGITDWAQEIFRINSNGDVEKLCLADGDHLNAYCLNRIDDTLYAYEFTAYTKNVTSLYYCAERCFQYRLGTNVMTPVEWSTDEIMYESNLINMLKDGARLYENNIYNLEFMIQHINFHGDRITNNNENIGERIFNRLQK